MQEANLAKWKENYMSIAKPPYAQGAPSKDETDDQSKAAPADNQPAIPAVDKPTEDAAVDKS